MALAECLEKLGCLWSFFEMVNKMTDDRWHIIPVYWLVVQRQKDLLLLMHSNGVWVGIYLGCKRLLVY